MAGIEAAGLILGVLPILISGIEKYNTVLAPFRRYLKYDHELKAVEARFITQRTIYEEETQFLLRQSIGQQLTNELLADPSHPSWRDESVQKQFNHHLGSCAEAIAIVARSIESTLEVLSDDIQNLTKVTKQELKKHQSQGIKLSRKVIAEKLSFSFSQNRFDANLAELSARNLEFQTLVKLVLKRRQPQRYTQGSGSLYTGLYNTKPFRLVQQESIWLHEILQQHSCSKHNRHTAQFNLAPKVEQDVSTCINFDVHIRGPILDQNSTVETEQVFKLTIESLQEHPLVKNNGHGECHGDKDSNASRPHLGPFVAETEQSLVGDLSAETNVKNPSGFVHRLRNLKHKEKGVSPQNEEDTTTPIPLAVEPILRGFLDGKDICSYVCEKGKSAATSAKISIGCLEKEPQHQLNFFLTSPPKVTQENDYLSFQRVLELVKTRRDGSRLSEHERYFFARIIAAAALNFYNTPWSQQESWRSHNIYLCDIVDEPNQTLLQLGAPFVSIPLLGEDSWTARRTTITDRPWIPNPLMFGVALLLIELAMEQPLQRLQIPSDVQDCTNSMDAEYKTATRLLPVVGRTTSPSYEKLVGNCLRNFGFGEGFSSSELQELYYNMVICELLKFEKHFANFSTADCDCQNY